MELTPETHGNELSITPKEVSYEELLQTLQTMPQVACLEEAVYLDYRRMLNYIGSERKSTYKCDEYLLRIPYYGAKFIICFSAPSLPVNIAIVSNTEGSFGNKSLRFNRNGTVNKKDLKKLLHIYPQNKNSIYFVTKEDPVPDTLQSVKSPLLQGEYSVTSEKSTKALHLQEAPFEVVPLTHPQQIVEMNSFITNFVGYCKVQRIPNERILINTVTPESPKDYDAGLFYDIPKTWYLKNSSLFLYLCTSAKPEVETFMTTVFSQLLSFYESSPISKDLPEKNQRELRLARRTFMKEQSNQKLLPYFSILQNSTRYIKNKHIIEKRQHQDALKEFAGSYSFKTLAVMNLPLLLDRFTQNSGALQIILDTSLTSETKNYPLDYLEHFAYFLHTMQDSLCKHNEFESSEKQKEVFLFISTLAELFITMSPEKDKLEGIFLLYHYMLQHCLLHFDTNKRPVIQQFIHSARKVYEYSESLKIRNKGFQDEYVKLLDPTLEQIITTKKKAKKEGIERVFVSVIVVSSDEKILLQRRNASDAPELFNLMSATADGHSDVKELFFQNALRELQEETGLKDITIIAPVIHLSEVMFRDPTKGQSATEIYLLQSPFTAKELLSLSMQNTEEVLSLNSFTLKEVHEMLISSIKYHISPTKLVQPLHILTPQATSALLNAFLSYLKISKTKVSIPKENALIRNSIITLDLSDQKGAELCIYLLEQIEFLSS